MSADAMPLYAAHLYSPKAIELLLQARTFLEEAERLLEHLGETGEIAARTPAAESLNYVSDALNMLTPDDELEEPTMHLVVDNTRPEAGS